MKIPAITTYSANIDTIKNTETKKTESPATASSKISTETSAPMPSVSDLKPSQTAIQTQLHTQLIVKNRILVWKKAKQPEAPLDLSGLGLTTFPADLPRNVQNLNISKNLIKELPKNFFDIMPDLRNLDVSRNKLQHLPCPLPELLKNFNAAGNEIEELPDPLWKFSTKDIQDSQPSLENLDVSDNKLKKLPEYLPFELQYFNASGNQLTSDSMSGIIEPLLMFFYNNCPGVVVDLRNNLLDESVYNAIKLREKADNYKGASFLLSPVLNKFKDVDPADITLSDLGGMNKPLLLDHGTRSPDLDRIAYFLRIKGQENAKNPSAMVSPDSKTTFTEATEALALKKQAKKQGEARAGDNLQLDLYDGDARLLVKPLFSKITQAAVPGTGQNGEGWLFFRSPHLLPMQETYLYDLTLNQEKIDNSTISEDVLNATAYIGKKGKEKQYSIRDFAQVNSPGVVRTFWLPSGNYKLHIPITTKEEKLPSTLVILAHGSESPSKTFPMPENITFGYFGPSGEVLASTFNGTKDQPLHHTEKNSDGLHVINLLSEHAKHGIPEPGSVRPRLEALSGSKKPLELGNTQLTKTGGLEDPVNTENNTHPLGAAYLRDNKTPREVKFASIDNNVAFLTIRKGKKGSYKEIIDELAKLNIRFENINLHACRNDSNSSNGGQKARRYRARNNPLPTTIETTSNLHFVKEDGRLYPIQYADEYRTQKQTNESSANGILSNASKKLFDLANYFLGTKWEPEESVSIDKPASPNELPDTELKK